ncbi:vWA domain-containing protein [Bradyrhizobium sp. CCBAU 11357]|uniref:vWA domain-containing protein n=1 Tax=Bradyrhizobium sp. CCBAU 11357 TaxID=1630808 RepID=UPI0023032B86|nr:vWA domain-containing protein [Bradyrhizobium sp. CCBAU 11357]MDA9499552.1 von Willebrand factor A [Bradyrhizobium sp. CCBAU 11357]
MAYTAEISRDYPTCILFLIDLSASMAEEIEAGVRKADFLADSLNRSLMELVIRCRKAEGVLNYFDIGVIAYSGNSSVPGFGGALAGTHISDVASLAKNPIRVETRRKKVSDGAGGLVETEVKFPVWFDPTASGGTPMRSALLMATDLISDWCREHQNSFPPTIIHVTDGEPTDGNETEVEQAAQSLTNQRTKDGGALLLNLHVSGGGQPVRFPTSETALKDSYARMLYRMSSVLPPEFQRRAAESGVSVSEGSRGYIYNAKLDDIVTFFDIGTRPRLGGPDR